jgi:hypothetical protein
LVPPTSIPILKSAGDMGGMRSLDGAGVRLAARAGRCTQNL